MRIRVNGAERETGAATVGELLDELGLPRQTVLVERNAEALERELWDGTRVGEGDAFEILRVAAGG